MQSNNANRMDSLRLLGVDALLPAFNVYVDTKGTAHLAALCGGVPQSFKATEMTASFTCETCKFSREANLLAGAYGELDFLRTFVTQLKRSEFDIEDALHSHRAPDDYTFGVFDEALTLTRLSAPWFFTELSVSEYFTSLIPVFQERVAALDEKVVSYLRSSRGRRLARVEWNLQPNQYDIDESHLLVSANNLQAHTLIALEAFGKKVTSDVYLISGEPELLTVLQMLTTSSAFFLDEVHTPVSVVNTMVSLWEPGATSVFGDAQNALNAAMELTPEAAAF